MPSNRFVSARAHTLAARVLASLRVQSDQPRAERVARLPARLVLDIGDRGHARLRRFGDLELRQTARPQLSQDE